MRRTCAPPTRNARTGIVDMAAAASAAKTEPLSECERSRLAARKTGGCGLIAMLAGVALLVVVLPVVLIAMEPEGLSWGAAGAIAFFVVCGLGLTALVTANADGRVEADAAAGIKLIVTGRIVQMPSDSSDGGPPYRYLWVAIDGGPSRPLIFHVDEAVYGSVRTDDAVRIAYVPNSKTLIELRTAGYAYSICDKGEAEEKRPA
ncbi:hypothetical protein PRJ39_18120 [Lysobacter enzymogenes]|uniref:hypothetical protein n=1 Tax=Lysobacter enzymogenes TaxID=69 RepID=UPI0037485BE9